MIIRNLRFGYDGGGMSCSGYVEGARFAELALTKEASTYFVTVMVGDAFEHIEEAAVSQFPIMDVLIHANNPEINCDNEYDRARGICVEYYSNMDEEDYILLPEKTWKSAFANAIRLAFHALDKYESDMTDTQAVEVAASFIAPYLDKDIDNEVIPDRVIPSWIEERLK